MRYIGGKSKLLDDIHRLVKEKVNDGSKTFLDLFSGTGCVGDSFKNEFQVYANDKLYFSYLLSAGSLQHNTPPVFEGLRDQGIDDPLDYLNTLAPTIDASYFIYHNYSPKGQAGRMYFTPDNAAKIDAVRQKIQAWADKEVITKGEYEYLLCALIEAVPYVSNTTGTYGAYLKHWDNRAKKSLELIHPILVNNGQENKAFNEDAAALASQITVDVCYIDPPYNARQYTSNYHLLETIALYDAPKIKGITGVRQYGNEETSRFCRKREAYCAFEEVIANINAKHIVISYSSDGILSKSEIKEILEPHSVEGSYDFKPISYNTYKSKIAGNDKVSEYLFYVEKK